MDIWKEILYNWNYYRVEQIQKDWSLLCILSRVLTTIEIKESDIERNINIKVWDQRISPWKGKKSIYIVDDIRITRNLDWKIEEIRVKSFTDSAYNPIVYITPLSTVIRNKL